MSAEGPRTRWGGIADGHFRRSGFFHVARRDGVFWLVDPNGGRFLSKGVNTVRLDQDQIQNSDRIPYADACRQKYGSENKWRAAASRRLAGWGFNTLGSWSDEAVANAGPAPLAIAPNLYLGTSFTWKRNERDENDKRQEFPDVFDAEFDIHVRQRAHEFCARRSGERGIIGWFADNELRWAPDWRGADELLTLFLKLPAVSPGRAAAIEFLRARQRRAEAYDSLDCEAFAALVAARYFELTTAAIKAADRNHLVLGCRFAYVPPAAVLDAAGRHLDVISLNCYELDANATINAYARTGKPCLIGEFSFRAADSGLPNTEGAGPKVATQSARAACFQHYVTAGLPTSGAHWLSLVRARRPAGGRPIRRRKLQFRHCHDR